MAHTTAPRTKRATTTTKKSAPRAQQTLPATNEPVRDEPQRIHLLWVSVITMMAIVVGGWLLLARTTIFRNTSHENPFRAVFEQVKGVFTNDRSVTAPSSASTTNANDAQLEELRQQVFPQFGAQSTESVNGE